MGRYRFDISDETRDKEIRDLLEEDSIKGSIGLSLRTSPSFHKANEIKGRENKTLCVTDEEDGSVAGIGTVSVRPMYVNGRIRKLGYLSNLKISEKNRRSTLLAKGYRYIREIIEKEYDIDFCISTIIESNEKAKEILLSRRCGLPAYIDFGPYICKAVSLLKKRPAASDDVNIIRGKPEWLEKIIEFLNEKGRNKQFYPLSTMDDFLFFLKKKNLGVEDFYIAMKQDRIVGLLAKWDQMCFKQVVVTDYRGNMKWIRPLYNFYSRLKGFAPLPESSAGCERKAQL